MIPQREISEARPSAVGVSFANILVATDFSETANRALEHALSFARAYNSKVFLTHVIPADLMMAPELAEASRERMREAAHEGMEKTVTRDRFFGVRHEQLIEEGSLWPTIEFLIERHNIDLLVAGTHGKGFFKKVFLGSSTEEIFRQARIPVLTVGPGVRREPYYGVELKHILFPTAFGPGSKRQAAYAFSLAQEHRSKLTLLHVQRRPDEEETIVQQLRELIPSGVELHCLPLFRVEQGPPAEGILRVAEDIQASLIVIGAKSRKGLAGHVPHTKAYQVVCGASCPVLTIKS